MRKLFVLAALAAVVAVLGLAQGRPATANPTNLVVNGSFETPTLSPGTWSLIPDGTSGLEWSVQWNQGSYPSGSLELQYSGVAAPAVDDIQIAELDTHDGPNGNSNVRIYQDLDTCPGADYTVQYSWRDRTGANSMAVSWDNNLAATHAVSTSWNNEIHTWTASGSTTRIMFADTAVVAGNSDTLGTLLDAVSVEEVPFTCTISVDIDIKPGSDPNCINPDGHGVIPIAILTTATFDATTVDPGTVELNGAGVAVKGKSDKMLAAIEDVDGDGDLDLVVKIVDDTMLAGSTTATLTGNLFDGTPITGTDFICIVPPES